ncbi:helix-turn-helix domain-containing protein [Agromyces endophyticus]|uniref:helix-turn-helix domain-containing protein n=1 Tax=Agromyces sp. H17E-10 TaxID=2932244 RepID=UPI001FD3C9F2|nr:helix-turn-helix domain-containing protein [Agromyces sp. H17E-10]UOQ89778.1 helix-turn-helix domain-containing protein [Agromyces sp. H17E-10]
MTPPGSAGDIGRFLTIADAAEILAVDVAAVDALIRSGELPAIRVGSSGPWRIERAQLEVWIELQYEETRVDVAWNEGEYANITELSGVRTGPIRPVD